MTRNQKLRKLLHLLFFVAGTACFASLVACSTKPLDRSDAGPAVSTSASLLASNSTLAAAASAPIRIAFNTWIGYSSFYIAEEKGFFTRRNITVTTKVMDPLADKNAAILRDELDGMGGTIDSAVISAAAGVKGKAVFMVDRSNGTDGILVTSAVNSIADLKGKKIAVEEGFVGHFFLLYVLDKNSIPPSSVQLVPMTTDAAGAAFAGGKVDVAVTWEPYLSTAKKRPDAKVLISSRDVEPILADTLFLSDKFISSHRAEAKSLVEALQEANTYWLAHRDECADIVARRWKLSRKEVDDIMSTVELYTPQLQHKQFGDAGHEGDLHRYMKKAADLWYKTGVIKQPVDASTLIDGFAAQSL